MSERRILYGAPPGAPTKVIENGKEGDIPYTCVWSDGSTYIAAWTDEPHSYVRRFHGPLFNRALGDWVTESVGILPRTSDEV